MTCLIHIEAAQGGWLVRSADIENNLMFLSGAKAEASARALAQRLSHAGVPAEIRIRLRDGSAGGRYIYLPLDVNLSLAG